MSQPEDPGPAKLIIGLIMKDKKILKPLAKELSDIYGPVDMVSSWFLFDYTDYYEPEMGSPLFRRMLAFQDLIEQSALADIKNRTNAIEKKFSENSSRNVNIDPGFLLPERFVLATGKNFTHRIYIGKRIYADLTLIFQKGAFRKLPWTYPDYADMNMQRFLEQVRSKFLTDVRIKN